MKDGSLVIILWPLVVALIGALVYVYSKNAKLQELGRIAFLVGLLWTVFDLATRVVHL
jgi:chromate transport protein ChrA